MGRLQSRNGWWEWRHLCHPLTANNPSLTLERHESFAVLNRLKATILLSECNGRDIWPIDLCRQKGVPDAWIEELSDCFESGFQSDLQTIYKDDQVVNQFHGVQDFHLAYKLGEYLGVDVPAVTASVLGKTAEVQAIKEAFEEG